ncbi:SOS cell division inhibitor [Marinobacter sp. M216]|uniref:SOS cell division inhibitor n=1 Tax=Marinobacter albus TaxID=3030833 RepID=A0ABT7HAH0_9GAMM|nr:MULTISPECIES: SOS cell division inhibitor [unclassified Marinobacter]MBW7470378.1 SOS cell division inhibitor [Marinobacter sp. F4218]MDK9557357.1 SOS cell division inhibitor [Marinobacter sp. M216]
MADPQSHLDDVDQLMVEMGRAMINQDWDELARLNGQVRPMIEPLMAALESGALDAEPVRTRLQELQQLVDTANQSATRARQEAQEALKGVNENRQAAKAYQSVSSNRSK